MIDNILDIGLLHYLVLAMLMFLLGVAGIIISRNLLRIIMSLLLVFISIVIHFAAFGIYCDNSLLASNLICTIIILISTFLTVAALATFYKIYLTNEHLDIKKIKNESKAN